MAKTPILPPTRERSNVRPCPVSSIHCHSIVQTEDNDRLGRPMLEAALVPSLLRICTSHSSSQTHSQECIALRPALYIMPSHKQNWISMQAHEYVLDAVQLARLELVYT